MEQKTNKMIVCIVGKTIKFTIKQFEELEILNIEVNEAPELRPSIEELEKSLIDVSKLLECARSENLLKHKKESNIPRMYKDTNRLCKNILKNNKFSRGRR